MSLIIIKKVQMLIINVFEALLFTHWPCIEKQQATKVDSIYLHFEMADKSVRKCDCKYNSKP